MFQLVVAGVSGAAGGWIDAAQDTPEVAIDPDLTAGRIHRRARDSADARGSRRLALIGADVAVRLIRQTCAAFDLVGMHRPAAMPGLEAWADRVCALGADPARADARRVLTATQVEGAPAILFEHPWVGPSSVPATLERELDARLGPELHSSDTVDEATFCGRIDEGALAALDAWWAVRGVREATALYLGMAADVIHAAGDADHAALFLGVSDALAAHDGPAREAAPLAAWMKRLVNAQSAWRHRLAHIEGHAHH